MRGSSGSIRGARGVRSGAVLGLAALALGAVASVAAAAGGRVEAGRDLFLREWTPGDARSHGGDGLGPVYNDSSCVACHNAGGPGGGGPSSKNVDIVTAGSIQAPAFRTEPPALVRAFESLLGVERPRPAAPPKPRRPDATELIKAHAGFRTARSVVVHRFGTDPDYESWRIGLLGFRRFVPNNPLGRIAGMRAQEERNQARTMIQFEGNAFQPQSQIGPFTLARSQRNPTALFGDGLIDAIPVAALEAAARATHPGFPEVRGRVSRLKDGQVGRFGWKAQTASLDDFVRTACAVELGLEVPGHPQGGLPQAPEAKAKGLDLTDAECNDLVAYVAALPRPVAVDAEAPEVAAGRAKFEAIGCAACHAPKLGEVEGLYSDLLLHDLGPELGDTGQYGVFVPDSDDPDFVDPEPPAAEVTVTTPAPAVAVPVAGQPAPGMLPRPATGPASRQEWRTPPLWGFRDSGPYMHDGRAETLDQALAQHGGEADRSATKYFELSARERQQVQAFLKSLAAPSGTFAMLGD